MSYRLKALVHGPSGAGKSWLGASTPGPRLVLDAEGGSHFAKQVSSDGTKERPPHREWDVMIDPPPTELDPNESVFVRIRSMQDLTQTLNQLQRGTHEFRSVVLDSLTDIQLTCRYDMRDSSDSVTSIRDWGILLDSMIELCREFRDLTDHPVHPLECVLIICGSEQIDGQWRPQVQGGLARRLAGYFDVVMYLTVETDMLSQQSVHRAHVRQSLSWVAKDRTDELGDHVDNPDIRKLMWMINEGESSD